MIVTPQGGRKARRDCLGMPQSRSSTLRTNSPTNHTPGHLGRRTLGTLMGARVLCVVKRKGTHWCLVATALSSLTMAGWLSTVHSQSTTNQTTSFAICSRMAMWTKQPQNVWQRTCAAACAATGGPSMHSKPSVAPVGIRPTPGVAAMHAPPPQATRQASTTNLTLSTCTRSCPWIARTVRVMSLFKGTPASVLRAVAKAPMRGCALLISPVPTGATEN